jgi:hypothetical protein
MGATSEGNKRPEAQQTTPSLPRRQTADSHRYSTIESRTCLCRSTSDQHRLMTLTYPAGLTCCTGSAILITLIKRLAAQLEHRPRSGCRSFLTDLPRRSRLRPRCALTGWWLQALDRHRSAQWSHRHPLHGLSCEPIASQRYSPTSRIRSRRNRTAAGSAVTGSPLMPHSIDIQP